MQNIRIGTRLALGFGAVVLLSIALGIFSLKSYSTLQDLMRELESRDFAAFQSTLTLTRYEDQLRRTRENVLLSAFLKRDRLPAESADTVERRWQTLRDENVRALTALEAAASRWELSAYSPARELGWKKTRTYLVEAQKAFQAISPEADSLFSLVNAGNLPDAATRLASVERAATAYESRLNEVQQAIQENIQLGRSEVNEAAEKTRNSVVLVLVLVAVVGALLSLLIHRSIVVPIEEFSMVVERVGQGDLTAKFAKMRRDEIGSFGVTLDRMVDGLKSVASQTRLVAASLNSATAEILASTQQQAAATAEQAAAVQQANATMSEISQSGAQISERARQVATAAESAAAASMLGRESVKSTAVEMGRIQEQAEAVAENVVALSEKTQAIGEIITSVNEIAEQSHLLAVNASIQAVMAGEHGRSFSVVANEIRNLAEQSKQATLQVRMILGDIQKSITTSVMLTEEAVKRVESGRHQAGISERTIHELTESIEESIRAFQQIVGGSGQQQIDFEQVTQAFRNIGIASQQTATSTKQLENAASSMNVLALQLREAVERYRV